MSVASLAVMLVAARPSLSPGLSLFPHRGIRKTLPLGVLATHQLITTNYNYCIELYVVCVVYTLYHSSSS